MAVESGADRLSLLNDFGVDITVGAQTIKGIFDSAHTDVVTGEVPFSLQETQVMVRSEDANGLGEGSSISVGSDDYVVTDVQPDGTGMTVLTMEAQ